MSSDVEKADTFDADLAVADARADEFDALVLPGGTTNPDALRMDQEAVALVRAIAEAGKPVAAICHGPWMLVEADVVRGRGAFTLVTSRSPDDLPAFTSAAIAAFGGA